MDFINNTKVYACFLFNSNSNNSDVNIICDLFKIHKSTLYRWINEYNNIDLSIDSCCFFDFNSILITKQIVIFVLRFFIDNAHSKKNTRILMKKLNIFFPDNKISYKHINVIIDKNNHLILACNKYKSNNIKITEQIENFIIEQVKNNRLLVANDIKNLVFNKFNLNISLPTIYNIFKRNNYTYKRTKININPYSLDDQKEQLTNVYYHLKENNDNSQISNKKSNDIKINNIKVNDIDDEKINNKINNIKVNDIKINNTKVNDIDNGKINNKINNTKVNDIDNEKINNKINNIKVNDIKVNDIDNEKINNKINNIEVNDIKVNDIDNEKINNKILISIDEMSIITNRGPTHGWSLKNSLCEINIPFIKPNVRYSLLMASSNIKIVKYKLVKGSIKSDDYINFIIELNQENPDYSFLIDNASIHKSKKAKLIYMEKKINIIYNAPYQSEFNPIEMVFSLLRKKLNKKIVKNEESILDVIRELEKNIKKEELENIFRHCEKKLKEILKI